MIICKWILPVADLHAAEVKSSQPPVIVIPAWNEDIANPTLFWGAVVPDVYWGMLS